MEKRYFLNNSNSKYITIGIKPATKILHEANTGFFVEVAIDGNNMKMMSLGGLDGFMNLCKSLRSFDELKFTYPNTAANYSDVVNQFPLNISKKPWNGSICFHIESMMGGYCVIAQNSCSELLKIESLIVAGIKKLQSFMSDAESSFNEIVNKPSDFSETITNVQKSGDLLKIELLSNFNELLKLCMDKISGLNASGITPSTTSATKRNQIRGVKRGTTTKRAKKIIEEDEEIDSEVTTSPPKKSKSDHNYANEGASTNDPIEPAIEPITIEEDPIDSEFYV